MVPGLPILVLPRCSCAPPVSRAWYLPQVSSKAGPQGLLRPALRRLSRSRSPSAAQNPGWFSMPEAGKREQIPAELRPGGRCNAHGHNPLQHNCRHPARPAALLMQITSYEAEKIAISPFIHLLWLSFLLLIITFNKSLK